MKTQKFLLIGLFLLVSSIVMGQITITVNPNPTITITGFTNPTGCGVNDGNVTATGAGVGGTYTWNTTPPQNTATAINLGAGTYTVTGTTALGCSNTATQALVAPGSPTGTMISSDADNTICANESVDFTVTTTATEIRFLLNGIEVRTWMSGAGNNVYTTTTLADGDIVSAEVREAGCVGIVTGITTTVNTLPTITITGFTNPTGCGVNDGNVTATGAGVGGTYTWNTTPPQNTATAINLGAGTYTVTGTTALGCSNTATQALVAPGSPTGTMTSSDADNTICAGSSVTFTVTTVATEIRFLLNGIEVRTWMSGAGNNVYTTTTLADGDIVSAEVREAGCVGIVTGITTTVNTLPTATFGADASICFGASIDLTVNPVGGLAPYSVTLNNNTGDLVAPNNVNPVINIGAGGTATFSVQPTATVTYHFTVTDDRGCSRTY